MPNHCESDLKINGSKQDIDAFLLAVKGEKETYHGETVEVVIDANKIIPYPKMFADADKAAQDYRKNNPKAPYGDGPTDGYNSGGYEWCISNWGTKWGMYEFSPIKYGKTYAKVSFQSAWSPPLPVILKASELFPKIVFTLCYYERGAGFKGLYKVQAGEVLREEESDYNGNRGG